MTARRAVTSGVAVAFVLALSGNPVFAQSKGSQHWVATWASAQQQGRGAAGARGGGPPAAGQRGGAPAPPAGAQPATTSAAALPTPPVAPPPTSLHNQTVRMVVHTSIGGPRIRVQLSNAYGTGALNVGAAHVALRSHDSEIVPATDRTLTFNGQPAVTIPPGTVMISDAVDLAVPKLSDLAISLYIPGDSGPMSGHSLALHTTYISREGNAAAETAIADATTAQAWYWLASVDIDAPSKAATVVAFGDSITDGLTSTANANRSWPSLLAERLAANSATANIAVVNLGISGNRVLSDGAGVSALARFDRDVLGLSGVQWVMILEGINDISGATRGTAGAGGAAGGGGAQPMTTEMLIGGMRQMIERAHTHGIKVIGCTLTPYGNDTDAGEAMRVALNTFIRTSGAFDAVVDFEAATRDPSDPRQFRPGFNNTDRLHPNDAGYKAMADAVDLKIFKK